jgi:ParB-like chromosome segregation protein Spo0J
MTASWFADKIEQWPTAKLLPYARNARTHSDDQVAQIAASIAEFGFTNPILAGSDGVIVAGHGRLAAAQKLGLAVVPVVVLDHLSPTQRRALVIADNRIAENAGWDDAMLRIEIASLQDDDFDVSLTGFDADALAELMAGDEPDGEGETDDDAVPEVSGDTRSRARAMSGCWAATVCCVATPPWLRATTGFSMASRWIWSSPTRRTT